MFTAIIAAIGLPTLLSGVGGGLILNLIGMLSKGGSAVSGAVAAGKMLRDVMDAIRHPKTETMVADRSIPIAVPAAAVATVAAMNASTAATAATVAATAANAAAVAAK